MIKNKGNSTNHAFLPGWRKGSPVGLHAPGPQAGPNEPQVGVTYQGRGSVGMSVRKDGARRAAVKYLSRPF